MLEVFKPHCLYTQVQNIQAWWGPSVIPNVTVISAKASGIPSKKITSFQPKQGYLEATPKTLKPCDRLETLLSL